MILIKAAALAGALAAGIGVGLALAYLSPEPQKRPAIEWLETPRAVAAFSLSDENGLFDERSLKGQWTIVVFGFLHCPDICPTSLAELSRLADLIDDSRVAPELQYVFVSVDPDRDARAELSRYVSAFHQDIRGVTGKVSELRQLTQPLGIQFGIAKTLGHYSVAHSATFSIIDPQGFFRGRFRPGFDQPRVAQELMRQHTRFN